MVLEWQCNGSIPYHAIRIGSASINSGAGGRKSQRFHYLLRSTTAQGCMPQRQPRLLVPLIRWQFRSGLCIRLMYGWSSGSRSAWCSFHYLAGAPIQVFQSPAAPRKTVSTPEPPPDILAVSQHGSSKDMAGMMHRCPWRQASRNVVFAAASSDRQLFVRISASVFSTTMESGPRCRQRGAACRMHRGEGMVRLGAGKTSDAHLG